MIAVLGILSVGLSNLRFWPVALDLFCRSKFRSRSNLFNLISNRLSRPMCLPKGNLRCRAPLLLLVAFLFRFLFFVCLSLRVDDGFVVLAFKLRME
jgi:hypothetical protein